MLEQMIETWATAQGPSTMTIFLLLAATAYNLSKWLIARESNRRAERKAQKEQSDG